MRVMKCVIVFSRSFFQRVEEQEKETVKSGKAVKLVKGKVGKPKVKKMQLEETLPSPFGRRIEPQITLAMKADASKKLSKKKKVTKSVYEAETKSVSVNKCSVFILNVIVNIVMQCIRVIECSYTVFSKKCMVLPVVIIVPVVGVS